MDIPEELLTRVVSSTDIWEACEGVEDWFYRRDLVDLTVCGPQCPAWFADWTDHQKGTDPECRARFDQAPTGQPCPVMAARKEAP
jgi:hypothetical protein